MKVGAGDVIAALALLLGAFNFVKSWRKDRTEARIKAKQDLLSAVCRTVWAQGGVLACELFVVNNDIRPVTRVVAHFFADDSVDTKPTETIEVGKLSPGQEFRVRRIDRRSKGYRHVTFAYIDADDHPHSFGDKVIMQRL